MKKNCNVVMLSTKKASLIGKIDSDLYFLDGDECPSYQHLYIVSDDTIREGDWFYHPKGVIFPATETYMRGPVSSGLMRKVIATTDPELEVFIHREDSVTNPCPAQLPPIPESFIKAYCKAGGIDEVLIEFEPRVISFRWRGWAPKLKENGTIIVHRARTFSSSEVLFKLKHLLEEEEIQMGTVAKLLASDEVSPAYKKANKTYSREQVISLIDDLLMTYPEMLGTHIWSIKGNWIKENL